MRLLNVHTLEFIRLQEEVIKQTNDKSIFAWISNVFKWQDQWSLLATRPGGFASCGDIHPMRLTQPPSSRITNQYLEFESKAARLAMGNGDIYIDIVELNCYNIPGLTDAKHVDTFQENSMPASACLIALRESQNGVFHRILPGDTGDELLSHLKRACPRVVDSIIDRKSFAIALIKSIRNSATVLKPQSVPQLMRLDNYFNALSGQQT